MDTASPGPNDRFDQHREFHTGQFVFKIRSLPVQHGAGVFESVCAQKLGQLAFIRGSFKHVCRGDRMKMGESRQFLCVTGYKACRVFIHRYEDIDVLRGDFMPCGG
jgi:hypothetical protein